MVVIVTGYTSFVTPQYDIIFTFANTVLAKFVDTTCIFRDARAVKELRAMEIYNKQKNRYQLCLFLFINNVDFKNNNRNYRKSL